MLTGDIARRHRNDQRTLTGANAGPLDLFRTTILFFLTFNCAP
jgi:hypothetical protein